MLLFNFAIVKTEATTTISTGLQDTYTTTPTHSLQLNPIPLNMTMSLLHREQGDGSTVRKKNILLSENTLV